MSKANEPAYPEIDRLGHVSGSTNRDKLAMEIYVRYLDLNNEDRVSASETAANALRAADIFFEQLNK